MMARVERSSEVNVTDGGKPAAPREVEKPAPAASVRAVSKSFKQTRVPLKLLLTPRTLAAASARASFGAALSSVSSVVKMVV
ncbi:MAG TPA: hypothetical protein VJT74_04270 [Pyrinomonadaceae bacterium]|nr:hypothetical protein [Pyrinomonadaceae bacterium]